jgi:hypothetical protein
MHLNKRCKNFSGSKPLQLHWLYADKACSGAMRMMRAWSSMRRPGSMATLHKETAMNTTLIEGKSPAEYDATVLNAINAFPHAAHHDAAERLLIGVQNERGEIYRVIKIFGMKEFSDLIEKFREFGFNDEFAEEHGDKDGFDALISGPGKR